MKIIRTEDKPLSDNYQLFDVSSIDIGDTVRHDIYIKRSEEFIIIIEAHSVINEKFYNLLHKFDNYYILNENAHVIDDEEVIESINFQRLLDIIKRNSSNLHKTLEILYEANDTVFDNFLLSEDNQIDLYAINAIVESIIFMITNHKEYLKSVISSLKNDFELPTHSFNVCLYALHIGFYLKMSNKELIRLGTAALLHDIGKKKIDDIVHKNTKLNVEELEQTKKHVPYTIELLKENGIGDSLIIDAIEHHHERYDGSGYPDGLQRYEISNYASILAICDVFDALTIDRPHRQKYSTFEALKLMIKDPKMKHQFNNNYIKLLFV